MTGKINSYIIEIIEEAKSKTIQTGENKMENQLKKRMSQIFVILWIIVLLPSLVLSQTRLATSTLMMKSQASNGLSINPLTKGESRASFDYSMITGSTSYKSKSSDSYNDGKDKASYMKIGYDGKMSSGHFSGYYSSYNEKYEYTRNLTFSDGCTADYDTTSDYKSTTLTGVITRQLNEKTTIAGAISLESIKGDIARTDTLTNGCTWTATGTDTRNYSGSASADLNRLLVFSKTKISDKMSFGFLLAPEAGSKSKYSNDYSSTDFRAGNGFIIGGAIGSESAGTVFEGGLIIEQESKESGDGSQRDLFFLYETFLDPDVVVLAGYTNSESQKLKDGSTNVARPSSHSLISLGAQFKMDEGVYPLIQFNIFNKSYGDYGNSSSDSTKIESFKYTDISFAVNASF